eukprot:1192404-Prorocentrum_minimum.AAC.1
MGCENFDEKLQQVRVGLMQGDRRRRFDSPAVDSPDERHAWSSLCFGNPCGVSRLLFIRHAQASSLNNKPKVLVASGARRAVETLQELIGRLFIVVSTYEIQKSAH